MLTKKVIPQGVIVEALTVSSFHTFGTVIEDPVNVAVTDSERVNANEKSLSANQGTASKYPNVSPIIDRYIHSPRQTPSKPALSIFVCSPRQLHSSNSRSSNSQVLNSLNSNNQDADKQESRISTDPQSKLEISIMERHPYTTQTFIPLGLSPMDRDTAYLVVVAPTVTEPTKDFGMPDIPKIRAFIARGSQAVTYAPGTWHAPMIVIGKKKITFVVMQYVNGVPEDDCEEIQFICNDSGGVVLSIPMSMCPLSLLSRGEYFDFS